MTLLSKKQKPTFKNVIPDGPGWYHLESNKWQRHDDNEKWINQIYLSDKDLADMALAAWKYLMGH